MDWSSVAIRVREDGLMAKLAKALEGDDCRNLVGTVARGLAVVRVEALRTAEDEADLDDSDEVDVALESGGFTPRLDEVIEGL